MRGFQKNKGVKTPQNVFKKTKPARVQPGVRPHSGRTPYSLGCAAWWPHTKLHTPLSGVCRPHRGCTRGCTSHKIGCAVCAQPAHSLCGLYTAHAPIKNLKNILKPSARSPKLQLRRTQLKHQTNNQRKIEPNCSTQERKIAEHHIKFLIFIREIPSFLYLRFFFILFQYLYF